MTTPGFGSGSFGITAFGSWDWSWYTLYGSLPSLYREYDTEGLLEGFFDGLRPSFDAVKAKIDSLEDIRNPLRVRSQYTQEVTLRLGRHVTALGTLWQVGLDGTVNSTQEFHAESGRFRFDDSGKDLVINNSSNANNNKVVRVVRALDEQTLLTDPPLSQDSGPLLWELRDHVDAEEGIVTVKVREGYVDEINLGWILFDGRSEYEVVGRRTFQVTGDRQLYVEKYGVDGYIDSSGNFVSVAGEFLPKDVGKKLVIRGMDDPNEDGVYEIVRITGTSAPYTLELDAVLTESSVGLEWSVRPWSELDLKATGNLPRGYALQLDTDLEATATTFKALKARFTASDVGNRLQVLGSQVGNDGVYLITSVLSLNEVEVDPPPAAIEGAGLAWVVREPTGLGDSTQVRARAPSMISYLAQDFGIEIDARESDLVQRKWTRNVAQWIRLKGGYRCYEVVGELSDLAITAQKLYRIGVNLYNFMPSLSGSFTLQVGDSRTGRAGTDGYLYEVAGKARFYSPTSNFFAYDVGRHVRLGNTQHVENDGLILTIESVLDENTVEFDVAVRPSTPDVGVAGGNSVRWYIVRLYTTNGPTLPVFDSVNSDLMRLIVDGNPPTTEHFLIDKFSWETDWSGDVPVDVVSATSIDERVYRMRVQTPAGQAGSADVILEVGNWAFIDSTGNTFYVESLPVEVSPGEFTFNIYSIVPPSGIGSGVLRLICDEQILEDYSPSNKILVSVELGPTLAGVVGLPTENILQRALERIEQAKPIHAEVVFRFVQTTSTDNLNITATIDPHAWISAILDASVQPYFDVVDGDVQEADKGLFASVETIVTP